MKSKPKRLSAIRKRLKGRFARVGMLAAFVVLGAALVATMALPRSSSKASPKKYRATKAIVLDKATGALRKPTQEETDTMVNSNWRTLTNRSSEGLTVNTSSERDEVGGSARPFQQRNAWQSQRRWHDRDSVRVSVIEEAADFLGLEEE